MSQNEEWATPIAENAAASMSMADVELTQTGKKAAKKSEVAKEMNKEEGDDYAKPKWGMMDTAVFGLAAAGILMSLACMGLNGGVYWVYGSMMITLLVSPYVGYQRSILRKMDGLREVINQIRDNVNTLMGENDKINKANDELEVQVNHLSELEGQLDGIIGSQGTNANNFLKLLKENKEILEKKREQMEGRILQDLISVLFRADRDGDYQIDPEELDMLFMRFDMFTGVTYDKEKFKESMEKKGYGLDAVMDIVDNIFDHTIPDEDKVFKIDK